MVSALVVFHLTAVFVAPWRLSTPPALPPGFVAFDAEGRPRSDLAPPPMDPAWQRPALIQWLYDHLDGYMNLAFINHGYEFFAPDPAPSELIRITVLDDQNNPIANVNLPDRKEQWPRLFYHRHMMLASQASNPNFGESGTYRYYAKHLLRKYGGASARVDRAIHMLLSPAMVHAGRNINGSDTFDQLPNPIFVSKADVFSPGDRLPAPGDGPIRIPGESP